MNILKVHTGITVKRSTRGGLLVTLAQTLATRALHL